MLTAGQIKKIQKELGRGDSRAPAILNALGDPGRFKIFRILMKYRNVCVTDVAAILRISVPAASQQLRILEMTGLVQKERKKRMVCYRVHTKNAFVRLLNKCIFMKGDCHL